MISILVMAFAGLFFFSALLVAVLELGREIERGGGIYYSGLMASATILAGIGLALLLVAAFVGKAPAPPLPPPREPPNPRSERIKDLLEEFLVSFLSQLAKPRDPGTPGPK